MTTTFHPPLTLPTDLPPALRDSEDWCLVLDPPGLFIVAQATESCPVCWTAKAFFFVDKPKDSALRYRCLACVGRVDAAA